MAKSVAEIIRECQTFEGGRLIDLSPLRCQQVGDEDVSVTRAEALVLQSLARWERGEGFDEESLAKEVLDMVLSDIRDLSLTSISGDKGPTFGRARLNIRGEAADTRLSELWKKSYFGEDR